MWFPYSKSLSEFLSQAEEFRELLSGVCLDKTQLETAVRMLRSGVCGSVSASVSAMWSQITLGTHPALFTCGGVKLPENIRNLSERLGYGFSNNYLFYGDLSVLLTSDLIAKLEAVLTVSPSVDTPKAFWLLLQSCATLPAKD